jgi:hypothetical protein
MKTLVVYCNAFLEVLFHDKYATWRIKSLGLA